MRRYFAWALLFWLAAAGGAGAQNLDDQYVQIFNTIQEGDTLSATQPGKALAKYAEAQSALQRIQRGSPDWNAKIVSFRLTYLANKIAELSSGTSTANSNPAPNPTSAQPQTNVVVSPVPTNVPVVPSTSAPRATVSPAPNTTETEAQIRSLKEQVRQLQADRIMMEAKLKEALSIQPEADPSELARAQDKLKMLQKENDLLKTSIETEKSKSAPVIDPKVLQQAQLDLTEANRQLAQQRDLVTRLTVERDALLAHSRTAATPGSDLAALQAENQLLKQRLSAASANTASAQSASKPDDAKQLAQANAEIASLNSDKELLRLEKAALENRLKQYTTNVATSSVLAQQESADSVRVRQLERERDQLQKKLDAANKSLYGRKGSATASKVEELELELSTARARLEVFDARQVPYTSEELALMKMPETKLAEATPKSTKRPVKDLPTGSSRLVVEAQTWFASHQYDKAENAYAQVVKMDPKNVPALANYAAVEIEAGHTTEAEKSIRTALAEDPEDAFSLYVLGILKFREAKYDDSLDALSHAAKLDPDNAEIQNYLGLALSEKGMRGPAENALRKAIQLQPNYGGAHYNLAIIYLSQQPPAVQLARWHYEKAIAIGHPRNEELEQKLGKK